MLKLSLDRPTLRAALGPALAVLAGLVFARVAARLVEFGPLYVHQNISLSLLLLSLAVLVWRVRDTPPLLWVWWLTGALTLAWSQAPGHTLLAGLWEALFVAGFLVGHLRVGTWPVGALLILGVLLVSNLLLNLTATSLGTFFYLSGSTLYIAGAQALALLPMCLALWAKRERWWWLGAAGAVASLYAVGISGGRSVYVPCAIVLLLLVGRLLKEGVRPARLLLVGAVLLGSVGIIELAMPQRPLLRAIEARATRTIDTSGTSGTAELGSDFAEGGSFQTRLQMWEVAARVSASQPWGVGNAAYGTVFQHFLEWPIFYSRFVHNYYLETLASGGVARFAALLALLGLVLWRGWRSDAWPWALGALGMWGTFAFDVTGAMPPAMLAAFAVLGAALPPSKASPARPSRRLLGLSVVSFIAVVFAGAWWFWPCRDTACTAYQRLAWTGSLAQAARDTRGETRREVVAYGSALYPNALAVAQLRTSLAEGEDARRRELRAIIDRFPYSAFYPYKELARSYDREGRRTEANRVLRLGVDRFDRTRSPLGLRLTLPLDAARDLAEARQRLEIPSRNP